MANFNWVDYIILAILVLSMLGGIKRGLVKEVISLLTLVAAFVVACLFTAKLAAVFTGSDQVQSMVSSASNSIGMSASQPVNVIALGISFVILFVGTMIIGSIISMIMSSAVTGIGLGFINRLLGGVFGIVRGLLIAIVLIFLVQLTPVHEQQWWGESQFVVALQPEVQWLAGVVEPGLAALETKVGQTLKDVSSQASGLYQGAVGGKK